MTEEERHESTGQLLGEQAELTLVELCTYCDLPEEQVLSYIGEGIITPQQGGQTYKEPGHWRFSRLCLIELRRASRLQQDLGLNPAGVALALELMGEIEQLKTRLARFERLHDD